MGIPRSPDARHERTDRNVGSRRDPPSEHSVEGYPRHEVHLREVQGRLTELAPYAFPREETPEWAEKAKEYRSALHEHQHLRDGSDPWLYNMPP